MQKLGTLLAALMLLLLPLSCSSGGTSSVEDSLGVSAQAVTTTGIYEVSFNVVTTLTVKAGDVLRLKGFPTDWQYSSVDVNFDGAPAQMDLSVSEHGDSYGVSGWSQKIVVPFRGGSTQDLVIARGTGTIRVTFWASSGPVTTPDAPPAGPVVQELAALNTPLPLTLANGVFRISTFPTATYNVVSVLLEAKDSLPLSGQLSVGGYKVPLSGSSQKILFKERGKLPVVFDLSFPSPRKIAITWSVENRVPVAKSVPRTTSVSGATIQAKYAFAQDHAVQNDLSLVFTSTDFTDGAAPTVTRFEHNPQGVKYPDRPDDLFGPTYDISAHPKVGKRIQVALPVPEIALLRGIDESDITILHYNAATQLWNEIIPDRISDGYVYFTTDSFSSFFSRMKRRAKKAVAAVGSAIVSGGANLVVFVADAVVTIADGVKDGIKVAYSALVSGVCSLLEFNTYKSLFYDRPTWSATPGDLSHIVKSTDYPAAAAAVTALSQVDLQLLSSAPGELQQWAISQKNAEILLADIERAAADGQPRRFSVVPLALPPPQAPANWAKAYLIHDAKGAGRDYAPLSIFRFTSSLLAAAPHILELVQECDGMLGLADEFEHTIGHVKDFVKQGTKLDLGGACREALMLPADLVDWLSPDVLTCGIETASFIDYYLKKNLGGYLGAGRDDHVLAASGFLNVASVLLWADPQLRNVYEMSATTLRDEMHSFVGLTHELYGNGNIVIKSMAGVALWDMVSKGDKGTYGTLKQWLEAKSGDAGGYAEGTGYLQYINVDVPYLLSAMVRSGFIGRGDLPTKYLKSAEWLLNLTPYKTGNPVEIDDGHTYPADFFVYSYLNADVRYQSFKNPRLGPISDALRPLGLSDAGEQAAMRSGPAPDLPNVYFADGAGVVRGQAGPNTITLSVVAEGGNMRTLGLGHDQQDNGSVTLTHEALGNVIVDPGYNGFSKRNDNACVNPLNTQCMFSRFANHNVVMTPEDADFHGEKPNGKLTYGDIASALANQPNVHNLDWAEPGFSNAGALAFSYLAGYPFAGTWATVMGTWSLFQDTAYDDTDAHAGGADAGLVGPLVNDLPGLAVHGLEVKHTSTANVTDRRFLASFGGHMWIIDRPGAARTLWSRTNWSLSGAGAGQFANAFQVPSVPVPGGDVRLEIPQKDSAPRVVQQRTQQAGSLGATPVFVTALPNDLTKSTFAEVGCNGATCMQNTTSNGVDLVVVPRWGEAFSDCGSFFQGLVTTGQIVFAHRPVGSSTWTLRLIGEEAPGISGTTLGAQIGYAPDVVFQVGPNGLVALYPDHTTRAITSDANRVDSYTQHTYSQVAGAVGGFADLPVVRSFGRRITSIKVTLVAGDADDVGYVGNLLVTNRSPGTCGPIGTVSTPIDVTSQVTIDYDKASLVLRAQENCGVATGWGSATQTGRTDAKLHWEVTLNDGCN